MNVGNIISSFLSKIRSRKEESANLLTELLREKFICFEQIIHINNHVLTLMAEFSEKVLDPCFLDMRFVRSYVAEISKDVYRMLNLLNSFSDSKYIKLLDIYNSINDEIKSAFSFKVNIPETEYTIPISFLSKESIEVCGAKMANLAEVRNRLKINTPDGFSITSYAFKRFLEFNNLQGTVSFISENLHSMNENAIKQYSKEIHEAILSGDVPSDLKDAIMEAYEELCGRIGFRTNVALRSSAVHEDSYYSFAGLYSSFLNVTEDMIVEKYKEVIASLFNVPALLYIRDIGLLHFDMVMAVCVLPMMNPSFAGVLYTADPNEPKGNYLVASYVKGVGKLVVDGSVIPVTVYIDKSTHSIVKRIQGKQDKYIISPKEGGIIEDLWTEDINMHMIPEHIIESLAKCGKEIERHYGQPQDMEWAVDENENLIILQTRPLGLLNFGEVPTPYLNGNHGILINGGISMCKGVGYGKVHVVKDQEETVNLDPGHVLVVKHTNPKYAHKNVAAIISDTGSPTGHMATLCREYRIPAMISRDSTNVLKDGQEVTVDTYNCIVYEGKVDHLSTFSSELSCTYNQTLSQKVISNVAKLILPLNLIDANSADFKIEQCKTFHDITRYIHEMIMREMFYYWHSVDCTFEAGSLMIEIPISVLVLDIEGGLKTRTKKIRYEDIVSVPFRAVLKGMTSMKWPGAPPVDGKGVFALLAQNVTTPESQVAEMGKESFCVITKNYMNFSIRLGYHFQLLEAYASDNINANYVRFFFKGGGAPIERRLRRVRLITEILKRMDFTVESNQDVINATLAKYEIAHIEKALEVIGKLTAYTKQLDMALFNDAIVDNFIKEFIQEHMN